MLNLLKPVRLLLLFILTVFVSAPASADESYQEWLPTAEIQLKTWQDNLEHWEQISPEPGKIEDGYNEVLSLKQRSDACVADFFSQLSSLQVKLKALGDEVADETPDLKKSRSELIRQKQSTESVLARCRLLNLASRDLQGQLKEMRNKLLSQALTHREAPIPKVIFSFISKPEFFKPDYQFSFSAWPALLGGLVVVLLFLPLALHFSKVLLSRYPLSADNREIPGVSLLANMFARRLPWIVILTSMTLIAYTGGARMISAVLLAFLISVLLAPALELLLCYTQKKCRAGFPARVILDIVLIGLTLRIAGLKNILAPDALRVVQTGFATLLMVFSIWILVILVKRENFQFLKSIRVPVAVALVAGPLAIWLGYYSLFELLVPGVYGTLAGFIIAWSIYQLGNLFFSMFEPDTPGSSIPLRHFLGYEKQERIPGLWIGRLLLFIAVTVGFVYWLLIAWNIPDSSISIMSAYFSYGFQVGAINVVPVKIISAVLSFFLLMTLARWLKKQLTERWLKNTHLDVGAKESIVSLTSYAIIGIALVIAMGMAGVDFQNVAIVAGALSVGIGFGLQNIVNNFVSGLILLFERPVKPGDWIVVGATEGYVKKISIRYTLIQTFDRADVLVPNSELISGQVTNWMLRDSMGRVITPIGVAYGSDTGLVRDILYRVAAEHPLVMLDDPRVSNPRVLFMGFGDSALNFEVRCFIRDIDYKLSVRSDLLFAIDEAFRKAGIEVPFPQRVVHMTNDSDEHDDNNTGQVNQGDNK